MSCLLELHQQQLAYLLHSLYHTVSVLVQLDSRLASLLSAKHCQASDRNAIGQSCEGIEQLLQSPASFEFEDEHLHCVIETERLPNLHMASVHTAAIVSSGISPVIL